MAGLAPLAVGHGDTVPTGTLYEDMVRRVAGRPSEGEWGCSATSGDEKPARIWKGASLDSHSTRLWITKLDALLGGTASTIGDGDAVLTRVGHDGKRRRISCRPLILEGRLSPDERPQNGLAFALKGNDSDGCTHPTAVVWLGVEINAADALAVGSIGDGDTVFARRVDMDERGGIARAPFVLEGR